MAVPFRKTSKSVKRIRRGNKGLQEPALVKDPSTGEYRVPHQVDEKGFYKGEQVVEVKEKKEKDSNK
ncbi:MAG: 50S ribosomal protein L32 [Gammaproteobacteria bacterium]|nr:50S ribosomal protein L32 [Gammaproteobacteria bacterium]